MIVVSYRLGERCAKPDSSLSGCAKFKKMVGRRFRNANQPCIAGSAISLA